LVYEASDLNPKIQNALAQALRLFEEAMLRLPLQEATSMLKISRLNNAIEVLIL